MERGEGTPRAMQETHRRWGNPVPCGDLGGGQMPPARSLVATLHPRLASWRVEGHEIEDALYQISAVLCTKNLDAMRGPGIDDQVLRLAGNGIHVGRVVGIGVILAVHKE